MPTENWLLYVDESGDFDETGDTCVVSALLLKGEELAEDSTALREMLGTIFPLAPWPPHATELNLPSARVYYVMAGLVPLATDAVADDVRAAIAVFEGSTMPEAAQWRGHAKQGRRPQYAWLESGNVVLRRECPDVFRALQTRAVAERTALRNLLADASAHVGPRGFAALTAVSSRRPADGPPEQEVATGALRRDGYLDALETLIERAVMVVRGGRRPAATDVRIWARVATRHVGVEGIGSVALNSDHVARVAERAAAVGNVGQTALVRVRSLDRVTRYDGSVHPGVVLADAIANGMRRVLLTRGRDHLGWDQLAGFCEDALGIPAVVPVPSLDASDLPAVAVTGASRTAVQAAARREETLPLVAEPARWAREQAAEWVGALTRAWEAPQ